MVFGVRLNGGFSFKDGDNSGRYKRTVMDAPEGTGVMAHPSSRLRWLMQDSAGTRGLSVRSRDGTSLGSDG